MLWWSGLCGHKADSFPLLVPTCLYFFHNLDVSQQQHQVHPKVEHPMITLLKLSLFYTDSYFFFLSDVIQSQYDPRFGDAFWNSSKFGMVNYLLRMMSSWAIVCSVWYLPPMSREVRGGGKKIEKCCYLCSSLFAVVVYILNMWYPVFLEIYICFFSNRKVKMQYSLLTV